MIAPKLDIAARFSTRVQAERYRDRFMNGKRRRTHAREHGALQLLLRGLDPLASVLDVGSGPGRFTDLFAEFSDLYVQMDLSRHMLEISRDHHPLLREGQRLDPNVTFVSRRASPEFVQEFVQADAREPPFISGCFDLVFCHRLLNHIPDRTDRGRILRRLTQVSRRYVVVSSLATPAPLWALRRTFDTIRGRTRGHAWVSAAGLIVDGRSSGLTLESRARFRAFPIAEWLVFTRCAETQGALS